MRSTMPDLRLRAVIIELIGVLLCIPGLLLLVLAALAATLGWTENIETGMSGSVAAVVAALLGVVLLAPGMILIVLGGILRSTAQLVDLSVAQLNHVASRRDVEVHGSRNPTSATAELAPPDEEPTDMRTESERDEHEPAEPAPSRAAHPDEGLPKWKVMGDLAGELVARRIRARDAEHARRRATKAGMKVLRVEEPKRRADDADAEQRRDRRSDDRDART